MSSEGQEGPEEFEELRGRAASCCLGYCAQHRAPKNSGVTSPHGNRGCFLFSHPSQDEQSWQIIHDSTTRENPRTQE